MDSSALNEMVINLFQESQSLDATVERVEDDYHNKKVAAESSLLIRKHHSTKVSDTVAGIIDAYRGNIGKKDGRDSKHSTKIGGALTPEHPKK